MPYHLTTSPHPAAPHPTRRIRADETRWCPPAAYTFDGETVTASGINPLVLAPLRAPTRAGTGAGAGSGTGSGAGSGTGSGTGSGASTAAGSGSKVHPRRTPYATHLPDTLNTHDAHSHEDQQDPTLPHTFGGNKSTRGENPMQVAYGPQRRCSLVSTGSGGSAGTRGSGHTAYTNLWKHALEGDGSDGSASIWPESEDGSHTLRMEQVYTQSDQVFTEVMEEIREAESQRFLSATGPSTVGGPLVADIIRAYETQEGIDRRRENLLKAKSGKKGNKG